MLCHKEVHSPGDPTQPRQEAWAPGKNLSLALETLVWTQVQYVQTSDTKMVMNGIYILNYCDLPCSKTLIQLLLPMVLIN